MALRAYKAVALGETLAVCHCYSIVKRLPIGPSNSTLDIEASATAFFH